MYVTPLTTYVPLVSLPGVLVAHLPGGDDSRQREAVAHSLRHGDDVRRDAVSLEAPEVVTRAAETRLNLLADVLADMMMMMMMTIFFFRAPPCTHLTLVLN